jgi:hypothetical protein
MIVAKPSFYPKLQSTTGNWLDALTGGSETLLKLIASVYGQRRKFGSLGTRSRPTPVERLIFLKESRQRNALSGAMAAPGSVSEPFKNAKHNLQSDVGFLDLFKAVISSS